MGLEKKIVAVLEMYYNNKNLTLSRAAELRRIPRYDVIQYMIANKLSPETRSPIREKNLERLAELKKEYS